jgi:hypothetical protein
MSTEALATQSAEVAAPRPNNSVFNLNDSITDLPDLSQAIEMPLDLMSDYWTPEHAGEFKFVFFDRIDISKVQDQQTGAQIDLECAYFLEQDANKEIKSLRNGSKRLVGALLSANVQRGTALKVTFMGKKNNRTNSYKSDNWSVKPLRINIPVTD